MAHYCGQLSAILLRSRVRMKISVWKVLLSSYGKIEPSSIFSASFLKAAIFSKKKLLEYLVAECKKNAVVNAKKECITIVKQKCCKKFYTFDLIDNDVL